MNTAFGGARHQQRSATRQERRQDRRTVNVANWRALEREVRQGLPAGVTLRISPIRPRGEHWLFDRDGRRLVEFWPSRGTWWVHDNGDRGTARGSAELLDVIHHYAGLLGKGGGADARSDRPAPEQQPCRPRRLGDDSIDDHPEEAEPYLFPPAEPVKTARIRQQLECLRTLAEQMLEAIPGIGTTPEVVEESRVRLDEALSHARQVAWLMRGRAGAARA